MTKDVESPLNFDFLKLSKARFNSMGKSERKSETLLNESVPSNSETIIDHSLIKWPIDVNVFVK